MSLRYSANLSMLWPDHAPLKRFELAASAGFTHVEMHFPQRLASHRLEQVLAATGLQLSSFGFNAGNWLAGERGIAALPDRVDEFCSLSEVDLEMASRLGTKTMTVLAGIPSREAEPATLDETFVANLRHLGRLASPIGVTLTLEAINSIDVPGFT